MLPHAGSWQFWIDRGGTFTDLVGRGPEGRLVQRKVLSEQPDLPGDPAMAAIAEALGLRPDQPLPAGLIEEVRLGTTVATNALLERRTEPVLLLVNQGFADLLRIGDQHRPDIFALRIERPGPLEMRVIEVEGRLAADGTERRPLRLDQELETCLRQAAAAGYRSCAVALLHSYRNGAHESALGAWLQRLGFGSVLLSHQLSNQPRLLPRAATTVVEAALRPVLAAYLDRVGLALGPGTRLRVMTSSGALLTPQLLHAKDTILSGPAGGMVGAVAVAETAGFGDQPILGFDMGGTSTDVFHFDPARGETAWERSSETEISGLRLQAPMLPIHTVAAGGGSLIRCDGQRLQVGPRSAGAVPGPACYGRGGPLTVTDANLLLGRLPAGALPSVFGPRGDQPADGGVVRQRFSELAATLPPGGGSGACLEAIAHGALTIAIERMAEAIRRISIQRGHDIRRAVLVSFGSAGGQHACCLAASLGITRVLIHPLAGVLSAYGIGLSRQGLLRERTLRAPLAGALLPELTATIERLCAEAGDALRQAGDLPAGVEPCRQVRLELRYPGTDRGLELPWPSAAEGTEGAAQTALVITALREGFEALHRQRFGYLVEGQELVVERVLVELTASSPPVAPPVPAGSDGDDTAPPDAAMATVSLWLPADPGQPRQDTGWQPVPLWQRHQLKADQELQGPALVVEATGTTVLEPGWSARVLPGGELLLEHGAAAEAVVPVQAVQAELEAPVDPVRLELYNHRFSAIAQQMGVRLQQSSRSVNIRERLDFSCALFDSTGRLVANAPHIPVHLGSMGESVVSLLAAVERGERPPLNPGDAIAANNPFNGGTHLPDITVITPVFVPPAEGPAFFVACRGHHADVGGITPGSMPPFSHSIHQEGLLLDNVPLLAGGQLDRVGWQRRLLAGPHPVRNPDQLLADLQAQVAANQLGVAELQRLVAREGLADVRAYMGHVQENAADAVRRAIDRLHNGHHGVELDDGSRIQVAVRIHRAERRATVDFSGSSPQQPGNFNAPLAITKAVVLYVFRCLVGEAIPLNAGCFEPLELVVPPGCLLHPHPPAAVVAGNVETSQAVANALFAALGVMAAAQGTMNNLSFGNDRCQYYETICGGSGAGVLGDGSGFAGCEAIQSHMTNSHLTDAEILEDRFPVRLESFAIRCGSGGAGRWRGGDGVVRRLRFLEPMTVAILSGSRRVAPFGLAGGSPGQVGVNRIERADGRIDALAGCAELEVAAGDLLWIETPGGGGYGPANPAQES